MTLAISIGLTFNFIGSGLTGPVDSGYQGTYRIATDYLAPSNGSQQSLANPLAVKPTDYLDAKTSITTTAFQSTISAHYSSTTGAETKKDSRSIIKLSQNGKAEQVPAALAGTHTTFSSYSNKNTGLINGGPATAPKATGLPSSQARRALGYGLERYYAQNGHSSSRLSHENVRAEESSSSRNEDAPNKWDSMSMTSAHDNMKSGLKSPARNNLTVTSGSTIGPRPLVPPNSSLNAGHTVPVEEPTASNLSETHGPQSGAGQQAQLSGAMHLGNGTPDSINRMLHSQTSKSSTRTVSSYQSTSTSGKPNQIQNSATQMVLHESKHNAPGNPTIPIDLSAHNAPGNPTIPIDLSAHNASFTEAVPKVPAPPPEAHTRIKPKDDFALDTSNNMSGSAEPKNVFAPVAIHELPNLEPPKPMFPEDLPASMPVQGSAPPTNIPAPAQPHSSSEQSSLEHLQTSAVTKDSPALVAVPEVSPSATIKFESPSTATSEVEPSHTAVIESDFPSTVTSKVEPPTSAIIQVEHSTDAKTKVDTLTTATIESDSSTTATIRAESSSSEPIESSTLAVTSDKPMDFISEEPSKESASPNWFELADTSVSSDLADPQAENTMTETQSDDGKTDTAAIATENPTPHKTTSYEAPIITDDVVADDLPIPQSHHTTESSTVLKGGPNALLIAAHLESTHNGANSSFHKTHTYTFCAIVILALVY